MDKYDTLNKIFVYNKTKSQLLIITRLGRNHNKDKLTLDLLEPLRPSTQNATLLIQ